MDVVFHLVALKHVESCEYNPFEAITTNIVGTQNVIDADFYKGRRRTVFSFVRFGNVLGSSGSVVPTFLSKRAATGKGNG